MDCKFVAGECTCKSIPLFITIGGLVCPGVLMALLTGLCALRGIMEIEFVLGE